MLQVHSIKAVKGSKHRPKRVGRGNASGHGTMSTRGGKGQTARSGGSRGLKMKGFKFLLQSTPKLRGFKSPLTKAAEVYLADIEKHFVAGETVTLEALQKKGIVSKNIRSAKILSTGEMKKKIIVSGVACTKGARAKIEAAGGEVKDVNK